MEKVEQYVKEYTVEPLRWVSINNVFDDLKKHFNNMK